MIFLVHKQKGRKEAVLNSKKEVREMFFTNRRKKVPGSQTKQSRQNSIKKSIPFYIMFIPVLIYFVVFRYVPLLLSLVISVEKYQPAKGIFQSKWVGLEYYKQFIDSVFFWRLIRNTLGINFLQLTIGFAAPIILALLLNEVGRVRYKKLVQTVTYLPNFISSLNCNARFHTQDLEWDL